MAKSKINYDAVALPAMIIIAWSVIAVILYIIIK